MKRLFKFRQLRKKVHLALKTFVFAGVRSYCPVFVFQILIEEDQTLIKVFISTRYWAKKNDIGLKRFLSL